MADSKIEITVGQVHFSGEGPGEWLGKQLDKVLAKLPELSKVATADPDSGDSETENLTPSKPNGIGKTTLATFLKERKATNNQVRKFLATAAWLHDSNKQNRITTAEVTTALNTHNQGKLRNPAQSLIRNTGRGFIVKDGKAFYVTDEGREDLKK